MIQRIQTLWLVLAACCMVICFTMPVARYSGDVASTGQHVEARLDLVARDNPDMMAQMANGEATLQYGQRATGFGVWPLTVLAALCAVVAVASIFLYRNRPRQVLVVSVGFMLDLVYVFLVFFWAVDAYAKALSPSGLASPEIQWSAGSYAPIVGLIFFVLARHGIRKDEAKVRAADRLR